MSFSHPLAGHPDAERLRKKAGKYVREKRESAGLTQQQVAKAVGIDYYTMISQIELGKSRVPPDKLLRFAQVLRCEPSEFGQHLLQCYDPFMWQLLFGAVPAQAAGEVRREW